MESKAGAATWNISADYWVLFGLLALFAIVAIASTAIAIARALKNPDLDPNEEDKAVWDTAVQLVKNRRESLRDIVGPARSNSGITQAANTAGGPQAPADQMEPAAELAAIDLFVEKAQAMLTRRGNTHRWLGNFTSVLVFEILLLAIIALLWLVLHAPPSPRWEDVALRIASTASVAGILLGAAFFMSSLARAHLHEATTLYNRRHMLRSGRLFLYLKFSGADQRLGKVKRRLTVSDLERAFGGLGETSTAFKDIKTEVLTSTWLGQLSQALARSRTPSSDGV